jgi:hypothetical protein
VKENYHFSTKALANQHHDIQNVTGRHCVVPMAIKTVNVLSDQHVDTTAVPGSPMAEISQIRPEQSINENKAE